MLEVFETMQSLVTAIRNVRAEKGVDPRRLIAAQLGVGEDLRGFQELSPAICALAGIDPEQLVIESDIGEATSDAIPLVVQGIAVYLPMAGMLDLEAERQRLEGELAQAREQVKPVDRAARWSISPSERPSKSSPKSGSVCRHSRRQSPNSKHRSKVSSRHKLGLTQCGPGSDSTVVGRSTRIQRFAAVGGDCRGLWS